MGAVASPPPPVLLIHSPTPPSLPGVPLTLYSITNRLQTHTQTHTQKDIYINPQTNHISCCRVSSSKLSNHSRVQCSVIPLRCCVPAAVPDKHQYLRCRITRLKLIRWCDFRTHRGRSSAVGVSARVCSATEIDCIWPCLNCCDYLNS